MSPARLRHAQRRMHILAGAIVLAHVYAPGGDALSTVVRFGALPLLVLSGLAMWKGQRVLRLLRSSA